MFLQIYLWGAWLAQLVKCPPLAQVLSPGPGVKTPGSPLIGESASPSPSARALINKFKNIFQIYCNFPETIPLLLAVFPFLELEIPE